MLAIGAAELYHDSISLFASIDNLKHGTPYGRCHVRRDTRGATNLEDIVELFDVNGRINLVACCKTDLRRRCEGKARHTRGNCQGCCVPRIGR